MNSTCSYRCALGLLAGLVFAEASTFGQQQPPAPAQPPASQPPAPPSTTPVWKETAPTPTVITPTTQIDSAKLADKTTGFEKRDQPWKSVLEWVSNETGLPVIATTVPTGTFSFYGNPKKRYSIPEIVDILNEALLNQKYVLIRRDASITVVSADMQIDPTIVPRITPDKLKDFGATEIVSIVVQLNSLNADEIEPEIRKMMGPFKEVTALTMSNQLVLQDTAKTLRRVLDDIDRMEKSEKGQKESYSHECKYIKARDAERILKELLGDPNAIIRQFAQATQPQQQQQGGNQPPKQPAQLPPGVKLKMYYISVDDRQNTVLVSGPPDKIAQAKEILRKVDVPQAGQKPFSPSPPVFKTYNVTAGSAEAIAKALQEQYRNNTAIRISAIGGNQVMVYAGVDDQFEVAKLVQGAAGANEVVMIPVLTLDAEKVANTLKGMFQDAKSGSGPFIEAETGRGQVVVKGTSEQIAEVKAAMSAIVGGQPTGNVRIISLDRGSAAAIAAEIERIMNQTRKNPVIITSPNLEKPENPPAPPPQRGPGANAGGDPTLIRVSMQQQQLVDPQTPKPGTGKPVNITVIGNRMIISSEDPQALAMAEELARMIIQTPAGDGDFEVIKLKNAVATDAARVVDEAFNGPRSGSAPQQQQFGGFPFGGRFGMMAGNTTSSSSSSAANAKVRVIADPASNSLLIKASPVDMLSIKKLLRESIDSGDEARTLSKTNVLGPLKFAKANDVADVVREIYRDSMSSNSTQSNPGRVPFFLGGGAQPIQRLTDANGNPRPAALTVSVNEATNCIIVHCSDTLKKEIDSLVTQMEQVAQGSPRSIRVVSIKGIDPTQLQQVLDAMQAHPGSNANQRGGGFGNFGGGFGGFGGGGRGNMGGGRGNQGGRNNNRFNRAPDREPPGGPDFFEAGVKDDRQPANKDEANFSQLYDPAALAYSGEEQQQPPPQNQPAVPDIRSPRSPVTIEALDQLQVIIVNTENQADMEEVLKVIKFLQEEATKAEVQLRMVPLKQADATHVVALLNQVFARVIIGPNGNLAMPLAEQRQQATTRTTNPFFGSFTNTTEATASILMLPVPRFNSILIGAPKSRLDDIVREIERFDQPTAKDARPNYFPLKKAAASRVASQLQSFYATRYPNETDVSNQIRITADDASNTVIVQAAPADLAEIREMIQRIDEFVSSAINDLRIIRLRSALADEMTNTLLQAITQGIVTPSAAGGLVPRPGGGNVPGLGTAGTGAGQGRAGTTAAAAQPVNPTGGVTTKQTTLRFYGRPGPGGVLESGLLEDVHITPEIRSNSLIISAPEPTMRLLAALIQELDVVSVARAEMKIFTLKKADASLTANLLQQLFLGAAAARPTVPGAAALPGAAPTTGAGSRPLLTLSGQPAEGATLVDLKISVEDRSNSIIVAGSRNDLEVIEAIISRLEDSEVQGRQNEVYRLRNAAAADVATALQTFLTNSLTIYNQAGQLTAFQELQRAVVIQPEPISNTLLISATPKYYADIMRLICQLDEMPAQVVIQVLIADVLLNTNEEFGVELGLQSPVLFQRSIIPGSQTFAGQTSGIPLPTGVTVNSTLPQGSTLPLLPGFANPGFNFNVPQFPQTNFQNGPGVVGFQGLGNLGVGRVSPTSTASGLVFSAASDTFTLLIRALKTQGRLDILSRPQVMTLDNQVAEVNVGKEIPIVTSTTITATGLATNNIERRQTGVLLKVTPRITPDGKVLMRVFPEVSKVDPVPVPLGNGQIGTSIDLQQIETTVTATDGETIVIGGLIQTTDSKQENKIPGLGDLPWIGAAFRYRIQMREKRELLIILTPHIVRSDEDARRVLAEEARRINWIESDVRKVHGPSTLDAIIGPNKCRPVAPLPMLNSAIPDGLPSEQQPPQLPMPQPLSPQGPAVIPDRPGSPVSPATYLQPTPTPAPPPTPAPAANAPRSGQTPPANNSGKESRPWVFRRD